MGILVHKDNTALQLYIEYHSCLDAKSCGEIAKTYPWATINRQQSMIFRV